MRRWLRALLAAVAAIAALLTPPAPAADALAPARGSFAYTYDGQQHSTNLTKIQTERGPPTHADTRSKGREAVDVLSRGDSACTDNLRACTATAYDDPAVFARGAVATTTANGQVEVTNAGACSVQRAGVAAKSVDDLAHLTAAEQRSIRSLQRQVEEHQTKLDAYSADPDAYDNLGILERAPTPEIRQRIIDGRVRHLETEIRTFQDQIDKLLGGGG